MFPNYVRILHKYGMINLLYPNYEDEQQLFIYLKKYMMWQQEKKKKNQIY